jgi:hypothetical protein
MLSMAPGARGFDGGIYVSGRRGAVERTSRREPCDSVQPLAAMSDPRPRRDPVSLGLRSGACRRSSPAWREAGSCGFARRKPDSAKARATPQTRNQRSHTNTCQRSACSSRPSAGETVPMSASPPTRTLAAPHVTRTALMDTFAPSSSRCGTRRPHGRTSASASRAAPTLASDAAAPNATADGERVRASFSIEPPTVSSSNVPPSVQNTLTAADAIANDEARYANRRATVDMEPCSPGSPS